MWKGRTFQCQVWRLWRKPMVGKLWFRSVAADLLLSSDQIHSNVEQIVWPWLTCMRSTSHNMWIQVIQINFCPHTWTLYRDTSRVYCFQLRKFAEGSSERGTILWCHLHRALASRWCSTGAAGSATIITFQPGPPQDPQVAEHFDHKLRLTWTASSNQGDCVFKNWAVQIRAMNGAWLKDGWSSRFFNLKQRIQHDNSTHRREKGNVLNML